jgi:FtsZ-binding cell division protein ZapB
MTDRYAIIVTGDHPQRPGIHRPVPRLRQRRRIHSRTTATSRGSSPTSRHPRASRLQNHRLGSGWHTTRFAVRGKPNPAEGRTITPAYAAPQPSPEPVAIWINERTCDDLREQFDNLKEHYAKLSHRNDELDAARASLLRSEIKRWTEIQELRAEVEDQRTKYHALAMHSNKVCDERDELHADYNLSRADSLRLNAENQTLADERDELKAKNRQLHRNYQNADHDYCATASQNEELHAELEALRASTIESDLIDRDRKAER